MKKKIIIGFIVCVILALIIVIARALIIDNANRVEFEDSTMGEMIALSAGVDSVNKLRKDDLEKVKELNIGYTGYYSTLVDIEKCQQLETLVIGYPEHVLIDYYFEDKEVPGPESEERIVQLEKEIENIMEKCPNITALYISNIKGNCQLTNIDLLKKGDGLVVLSLYNLSSIDYSPLGKCEKLEGLSLYCCDISDIKMLTSLHELKFLDLKGTNIAKAEDILYLEKLEILDVTGTPLAENEEQLNLIYERFPDIIIDTEAY